MSKETIESQPKVGVVKPTFANPLLAAGDKVNHPSFGNGEIFEISQMLGFADVNLDKAYIDKSGRKRDTVIVPISELVACR
jgi:hypothetical protein